jgi:hypothetical protein
VSNFTRSLLQPNELSNCSLVPKRNFKDGERISPDTFRLPVRRLFFFKEISNSVELQPSNEGNKLPSAQLVSVISLFLQHVSTSEGHLQVSSTKYIKRMTNVKKTTTIWLTNALGRFNWRHVRGVQIQGARSPGRTPWAYVPPSVWETKFHTHTKLQAKL